MDTDELKKRFAYHAPKATQADRFARIRLEAQKYALLLDKLAPDSREKSLAITHLEEAVFWTNAAIARHE